MRKAKQKGGTKLDHFDGFLTGFYKRNGFIFSENDIFEPIYAPKKWDYKPVDINNPNTSIYVNEYKVSDISDATERYNKGLPDIVYRKV